MTKGVSKITLKERAEISAELIGDGFLEVARQLREAQDVDPGLFREIAKHLGIGRRKAFALAQFDRRFHDLGVERGRLRRIGWSKLVVAAPYVTADTVEDILSLAETCSAYALKRHLRGETVHAGGRCVLLYFSSEQYAVFEAAVLAHGGISQGRGLCGTEAALTLALGKTVKGGK
ncbi:hypothetical protein [Sphingosinicella microcystinivorans]|uniref:hypothetical protein n=1 Tax=Sphingosinicella microcystinivorans TaxID=335406 RepID=UPI0022F3CA05|nr:hypothetical protein [Sphingosinicella microcystinivorans]WBX85607.1 hypothetical protein PE061_06750 [Sphingosinicella microcystinivorans]